MDKDYRRAANITVILAGLFLLFWLFIKYALVAVMPFLLGAAVAAIISPLSKRLSFRTKISQRFISGALVLILFLGISALLYLAGARLVREIGNLVDRITQDPSFPDNMIGRLTSAADELDPTLKDAGERLFASVGIDVNALIENAISSIVGSISSSIPSYAVKIVAGVPSFAFFTVVFLISAFYFATDYNTIKNGLKQFLPDSWQKRLPSLGVRIKKTISGYLKAYFFIMLLTFVEMFIGLSLLSVNYALLIALLVAVVDIFPILGTGTILIPWAIFSIVSGNVGLGSGLLILYGVSLIVRQIVEPKIVGNSIGLHPLATLAAVYLGIKFTGFLGIFIGPIVALCIKGFSREPTAKQNGG